MVGRCARCTGPRIDVVKRHERGCSELHGFKTRTVFCVGPPVVRVIISPQCSLQRCRVVCGPLRPWSQPSCCSARSRPPPATASLSAPSLSISSAN